MTQTTRITTPPLHLVPASAATHATSFQGHTLIVPTVSFASVPQLAVDLLLYDESLQLDKAGAIDTCGDLIPFVGPSDSKRGKAASGLITTPLEGEPAIGHGVRSSSHATTVERSALPCAVLTGSTPSIVQHSLHQLKTEAHSVTATQPRAQSEFSAPCEPLSLFPLTTPFLPIHQPDRGNPVPQTSLRRCLSFLDSVTGFRSHHRPLDPRRFPAK